MTSDERHHTSVTPDGASECVAAYTTEDAFCRPEAPVGVVGVDDTPISFSSSLVDDVVPGPDDIERAIRCLTRCGP